MRRMYWVCKSYIYFYHILLFVSLVLSLLGAMGFFGLPERLIFLFPFGIIQLIYLMPENIFGFIMMFLLGIGCIIMTYVVLYRIGAFSSKPIGEKHIKWGCIYLLADILTSSALLLLKIPVYTSEIALVESIVGSLLLLGNAAIMTKYNVTRIGLRINLTERSPRS